jgi:hypothetical protein
MKKILLLRNEARGPTQLLQDAVSASAPIGEIEIVAGCNCDRWGHRCPGCVEHIVSTCTGASDFNTHEEMR